MSRPALYAALLAIAIGPAIAVGPAGAAEYGLPLFGTPVPVWTGPSPFAVTGSAYGLSGYGYYYDEPTEHRFGGATSARPRLRRTADLRRRARR